MIIDRIRAYFLSCPILDEFAKLNIDYLGVNAREYTIDPVPSGSVIKNYIDGGTLRQYLFVFASREFYGDDVIQNIENSGFYEKLSNWLELQNDICNLPDLGDERKAIKFEVISSAYLFGAEEDSARYQIQIRLIYYEGGR